ncbi:chromosome segregation protein SMC [Cryobacterium sandaracinum]|uniref:Chromosome segregation protein SMC n=1 Tax=Cryobacterium sandaracinum TaxID=1259247 RepID=A0ABY2JBX1_9MICO|nr:ATP-binding protein [Cryobacterium sandaracinum]TFD01397.1 chromosome segregation protein SMC [Cryobacterium sandaracinum]
MLESIRVQRFKSVDDSQIELGKITVLVGPNNAGKSSVLQAVQFAVSVAQSLRLDGVSKWAIDSISGTLSTQQLVYTPLRDVHALAAGGTLKQDQATAITVEFNSDDKGSATISVARGKNKNIAVGIKGKLLGTTLEDLEDPFSVVAPGLAGIPSFEEYKSPGLVRRAAARGDANSVFRNVLWTLKQDIVAWREFQEALHHVFPDIQIDVDFNEQTDEHISAVVARNGVTLPIDSCGTGILQAIQVLSYIGVYKPKLLILDEPDSHLHPDNQRKLARLLNDLATTKGFQVLMSTHSRHFLAEFGVLGAKIHWFSGGQVQGGDLDYVKVLLDLGALDAGDRLRNGKTPVIVITEDSRHDYIAALLDSSGIPSSAYDIWGYNGSSRIQSAQVLSKFIAAHAPGTLIIVHRDRDYLDDSEIANYVDEIKQAGAIPLITEGTDIESHFLSPAHLGGVFPELDEPAITALLDEATSRARSKSIKNMINARTDFGIAQKRLGGSPPSAGSVAAQAPIDFDADPLRYRHGKATMGFFQVLVQAGHHLNRAIATGSSAASVTALEEVANSLTMSAPASP